MAVAACIPGYNAEMARRFQFSLKTLLVVMLVVATGRSSPIAKREHGFRGDQFSDLARPEPQLLGGVIMLQLTPSPYWPKSRFAPGPLRKYAAGLASSRGTL